MHQVSQKNVSRVTKCAIVAACLLLTCCVQAAITNLSQIVGREIDRAVVSEIPRRDFSTPERAYLNFIRSMAVTNEADWVAGFSPQTILSYVGAPDPDALDETSKAEFAKIFTAEDISDLKVVSYCISNATDRVRIRAEIEWRTRAGVQTNSWPVVFTLTNSVWRIDDFLDDITVE